VADARLLLLDAVVSARRYNNVVSDWTQCRTRLTLLTSGEGPVRAAADPDEVPRRSFLPAATWRVALEVAEANGWKRTNEWSYAQRSDLDRSLAALGLRQDEVEALYRVGELELSR
jgi:hypothetical protein